MNRESKLLKSIPYNPSDYSQIFQQIDKKVAGFQVLREYTKFYRFGEHFFSLFTDKYDISESGKVRIDNFRQAMQNNFLYFFTRNDVECIINDAPRDNDYIFYEHLYNIVSTAREPQTGHALVNLYCLKYFGANEDKIEEAKIKLNNQKENFFNQREQFEFYKYDLNMLEIDMIRDDWESVKAEITEQEEKSIQANPETLGKIQDDRQFRKNQEKNNELIIRNYPIKISKEIYNSIKPDTFIQGPLNNDQIQENIAKALRVKLENTRDQFLFLEDFRKWFYSPLFKQFVDLGLTEDEIDLLYYLIWRTIDFKHFTIQTFIDFIIEQKDLTIQDLIKLRITLDKQKKLQVDHQEVPRLFRQLVKFAHQYGPTFMDTSLKPLQETSNSGEELIELSNLRLYFKSLQITFEENEIQDLKLYLSQNGVIILDNYDKQKFLMSNCFIDCNKLMQLLEAQNQALANLRKGVEFIKSRTKEQARNIVQRSIIKGVIDRLVRKVRPYRDENNMINEIKLRQIIAEMFPEINQQNLDLIFDNMEQNTIPSKYLAQRKIYIPEFASFIQSGLQQREELLDDTINYSQVPQLMQTQSIPIQQQSTIAQQLVNQQSTTIPQQSTIAQQLTLQQSTYIPPQQQQIQQNIPQMEYQSTQYFPPQQQLQSPLKNKENIQKSVQFQSMQQSSQYYQQQQQQSQPQQLLSSTMPVQQSNLFNSSNNQQSIRQQVIQQEYLKKEEKKTLVIPKEAGFVTNEPKTAFPIIQNNKIDIYTKFYEQMRELFVPIRERKYLSKKDQIQKSCLELKKMLKELDIGEGIIKISQFRGMLQDKFRQLTYNEQSYLVNECEDSSAIKDTKLAEGTATYHGKKHMSQQEKDDQYKQQFKRTQFKNPLDAEVSYSWFCVHVQNQLFEIML